MGWGSSNFSRSSVTLLTLHTKARLLLRPSPKGRRVMIADADIVDAIREHCLVYSTRTLPRGHIRVDTKLLYPDGSAICLFVERGLMSRESGLGLSDFG